MLVAEVNGEADRVFPAELVEETLASLGHCGRIDVGIAEPFGVEQLCRCVETVAKGYEAVTF